MWTVSKPLRNATAGAREVDFENLCEPHVLWMRTGKRLPFCIAGGTRPSLADNKPRHVYGT